MFFHTHGPVTDKPLNFIDLGKRMVVRKKKSSSLGEATKHWVCFLLLL